MGSPFAESEKPRIKAGQRFAPFLCLPNLIPSCGYHFSGSEKQEQFLKRGLRERSEGLSYLSFQRLLCTVTNKIVLNLSSFLLGNRRLPSLGGRQCGVEGYRDEKLGAPP